MELEKIVSTILEKVGNTDVSSQTVKTLISLKPVAEGEEPDAKYFDEMVSAVKSFQGNVNNVFSKKLTEQVNAKVEEYKKSHKSEPKPKDEPEPKSDEMPEWARRMKEELEQERKERQQERAERNKKDLLAQVRKGLEEKFAKSGTKVNSFFAKSALSRIDVPEKDADVKQLIEQAERLYNSDMKEAGVTDAPHAGGASGGGSERSDEHEWDDVAKIVGRNRPKSENK